jgi:lambda family phage portal protein
MAEIVAPQNVQNPGTDPRTLMLAGALSPTSGFGYRPNLISSDILANRVKDNFKADAQDAARSNPYGRSATRTMVDAIIGEKLTLQLEPDADLLGVTADEAADWAEYVESVFEAASTSSFFPMDAQRKQTFTGLMRTAYCSFFVGGEAAATVEWKLAHNGQHTCLNLFEAERISDPRGMLDLMGRRRMGVERDKHGAPTGYHIRERHQSDGAYWGPYPDPYQWKLISRYTPWGRVKVLHFHESDRPDMTRGLSSFTTALLPMRLLQDYLTTELESAAIRATYAAVIQTKLDYEQAMSVIGEEYANAIGGNPVLDFTLRMMADKASYYRGQEFRFGKSKVAHLLPDEELKMVQGTQSASAVKDFASVNLYMLASALGVDYTSLTKDFSSTNYSGARAALFDVWRSYEVRRADFLGRFAWPFFIAWLEEQVVFKQTIPMLGDKSFYEVIDALTVGTFTTWTKPMLDPQKEVQAELDLYDRGASTLRDLCAANGRDWTRVLKQRAREKALMKSLDLKPEDIDWTLILNQGKDKAPKSEGTGPEGGASTGSSG